MLVKGKGISVIPVMIFLAFFLLIPACRSSSFLPEINADGAIIVSYSQKELRIRAYTPHVKLFFESSASDLPPILIENIAAKRAEVDFFPETVEEKVNCSAKTLSDSMLQLNIGGNTEDLQRVEIITLEKFDMPVFAVVGDSQGRNDVLSEIINEANSLNIEFLIHLGDMVPSGKKEEYEKFQETLSELICPLYSVPGNHDVRNEGKRIYSELFAPRYYYFDYGPCRFIFLDSSEHKLSHNQLDWLKERLQTTRRCYIFLHVPPHDPRGKEHGFRDSESAALFTEMVTGDDSPVSAVFAGHVHMFDKTDKDGVLFITSGGGGAPLYAEEEDGGFHHFVLVEHKAEMPKLTVKKVDARANLESLVVNGSKQDLIFTLSRLKELSTASGISSYQNRFGNFSGKGKYSGVPVRKLVEMSGGMTPSDILSVHSLDGYCQSYAYENVYPESCGWHEIQGEMILTVSFNGITVPDWQEGYRIAFLPPDNVYDNGDCEKTSAPGQGWHLYQSAGARWVKNVVRLEVEKCKEN